MAVSVRDNSVSRVETCVDTASTTVKLLLPLGGTAKYTSATWKRSALRLAGAPPAPPSPPLPYLTPSPHVRARAHAHPKDHCRHQRTAVPIVPVANKIMFSCLPQDKEFRKMKVMTKVIQLLNSRLFGMNLDFLRMAGTKSAGDDIGAADR